MTKVDTPRGFVQAYRSGALNQHFEVPAGDLQGGLARPAPGGVPQLASALEAQASRRGDRPAQLAAIERLRMPGARAVLTGQQPGLLLGPMLTLVKAMTAIKIAAAHDREDRPIVPVFWVASQDHDINEIDHAHLLGMDEQLLQLKLDWPNGTPSGQLAWNDAWTSEIDAALASLDAPAQYAHDTRQFVRDTYAGAASVGDAFARLLSATLGDDGLVVADASDPPLARCFVPTVKRALAGALDDSASINTAGELLKRQGFEPQLGRADGATNLFLVRPDGARELLRSDGTHYWTGERPDERMELAELEQVLDANPNAVTPAAGLRPVVQDATFPTAVTVLGPGELRYIAQLRGVYERLDVPMPLMHARATLTLLEPPVVRILGRYGLTASAFQTDPDGAAETMALGSNRQAFDHAKAALERDMQALLEAVKPIDSTLAGPVGKADDVLRRTLERLEAKTAQAKLARDATVARHVARLNAHLRPAGVPQERLLSPVSFFMKFGREATLRRLRELEPNGEQTLQVDP
jgi:bacillithiol biosynthesis cysteine-adding enzyme BshC